MWHYIGRNWFRNGVVPFHGGVDNKSPMIFAIYGLSDLLFGVNYWFPRLLGTAVQTAGLWLVYRIALGLSGKRAALIALTMCGLANLWRATDGKFVSLTETYAVFFLVAGFYQYFTKEGSRSAWIAGIFSGLAIAFRLSALFGATSLFLVFLRRDRKSGLQCGMGIIGTLGILLLAAWVCGITPHDLLWYGLLDNFGKGSATDHSALWKLEQFTSGFFYSEFLLFYPGLIGYLFMKKRNPELTIWLLFEFAGIVAVGIFARAHFRMIVPPLALINAVAISRMIEKYGIPFRPVYLMIWILFFPKLIEPLVNLKKIFFRPADNAAIYCKDPGRVPDDLAKKQLGLWVRSQTKEDDRVLVAGYGAIVQAYSERRSPSIYFNATQTEQASRVFASEIQRFPPRMVLVPVSDSYTREVGEDTRNAVSGLLANGYNLKGCKFGYLVYAAR